MLIDLDNNLIKDYLKFLIKDNTTKRNIIWATNSYELFGKGFGVIDEITLEKLKQIELQPRVIKAIEIQKKRTKKHAEVFTPSWICNKMNNYYDEQWFERKEVFNIENSDNTWETKFENINFSNKKKKTWQDYILLRQIEITCGEAPYLVSRYDTTTGELIKLPERIGLLDRKLRVINENTNNEEDWFQWVVKAYQSIYGYEFQGDNLFIARVNLLLTFIDYMNCKWKKVPTKKQLKKISYIISWNIWQMDGITYTVPFNGPIDNNVKKNIITELKNEKKETENIDKNNYVKIRNWRKCNSDYTIYLKDLIKERK